MKQILYILLLIITTGLCGCRKNLLDVQPVNLLTKDQIYASPAGVTAYFSSLYRDMPIEDYAFCNGRFGQFPGNGDQYTANWTDEAFGYGANTSMLNDENYPNLYKAIRNVNTFLQEIAQVTNVDTATKTVYIAEAKFVRAYYYFGLVRYYGGVPLLLQPQDKPVAIARNKETEVWDQIRSDLDFAAANLPPTSDYGRANKYVALALESRAMLHAGSIGKFGTVQLNGIVGVDATKATEYWQAAYTAAQTIISDGKYSLYMKYPSDLAKNFQLLFFDCKPKDANTEAIFCKGYDYNATLRTHSEDLMVLPDYIRSPSGYDNRLEPTLDLVEKFDNTDGSSGKFGGTGTPNVPYHYPSLSAPFANKDARFAGTVVATGTFFRTATITGQKGVIYNGVKYIGSQNLQYFDPATLQFQLSPVTPYVGTGNSNSNSQTFWLKKWTDPGVADGGTDVQFLKDYTSRTSWLDMRYGEVLLNFAEASFELGKDPSEALGALNPLRTRAGMPLLTTITRDIIRHERMVELAYENRTYWDYVRWRTLTTDFSLRQTYGLDIYYDIDTHDYVFYKVPYNGTKTYLPKQYYFEIPAAQRSANPLLIDNPGY
jgi:hypothetical protein